MWHPLNIREVGAIIALITGIGIAAIATERAQKVEMLLPAFHKPVCTFPIPGLIPRAWTDI